MVRRTVAALNAGRSPEEVLALATCSDRQPVTRPQRGDTRAEAAE
jgi:hypothetical protein